MLPNGENGHYSLTEHPTIVTLQAMQRLLELACHLLEFRRLSSKKDRDRVRALQARHWQIPPLGIKESARRSQVCRNGDTSVVWISNRLIPEHVGYSRT